MMMKTKLWFWGLLTIAVFTILPTKLLNTGSLLRIPSVRTSVGEYRPLSNQANSQVIRLDEYPVHPGYPVNLDYWIEKATPTIADINNDGFNEILVQTYNSGSQEPGKIYAFNASGELISGFPINTIGHLRGRLTLGDLDHDGTLEIVAGVDSFAQNTGGKVYIWRANGAIYPGWPQDTSCFNVNQYCSIASIVLHDIDGDSELDVIVATDNRDVSNPDPSLYVPNLYVWQSNGQPVMGNWPVEDENNAAIIGALAVGDLDNNGRADIAIGRDYNRLCAYDYQGNYLPGWPVNVFWPYDLNDYQDDRISFGRSAVTLADLDEDGNLEYIVNGLRSFANTPTFYNNDLLVYGSNGKRWRNWELPASGSGVLDQITFRTLDAPVIGDLDNDAQPDIVVATQDGWIRAYTAEKELLWHFDYAQGKILRATEAVIGDVDDDGWNEVLFGTFNIDPGDSGTFGVWILEHTGELKPGTPLEVVDENPRGISGGPTIADLDGDGKIEISAITWRGKLYVWDTPGRALPGRLPWPMARHDLQRTGLYIDPEPDFSNSTMTVSNITPERGETITFSFELIQSGTPVNETIQFTNSLPLGLSYVPGSLTATSGTINDSQAPILRWNGNMFETSQITISFSSIVSLTAPGAITNVAEVDAGSAGQFNRSITIYINGKSIFLPLTRR